MIFNNDEISLIMFALSDKTRFQILKMIYESKEIKQTTIIKAFKFSRNNIIKHLKILEDAKLIDKSKKESKFIYYKVSKSYNSLMYLNFSEILHKVNYSFLEFYIKYLFSDLFCNSNLKVSRITVNFNTLIDENYIAYSSEDDVSDEDLYDIVINCFDKDNNFLLHINRKNYNISMKLKKNEMINKSQSTEDLLKSSKKDIDNIITQLFNYIEFSSVEFTLNNML